MLQVLTSRETRQTFIGYCLVGFAGVAFYFALLWVFGRLNVAPFFAFTLSYVIATAAQFFMNKYLNFRAFDRATHEQAGTYVIVLAFNYAIMIAVEEVAVNVLHTNTMVAYALSIPINLPFGYLCHRFLTFGPGIWASLRQLGQKRG